MEYTYLLRTFFVLEHKLDLNPAALCFRMFPPTIKHETEIWGNVDLLIQDLYNLQLGYSLDGGGVKSFTGL